VSELSRVCENLKKKVENVVEENYEQWTGEINPTQVDMDASSDINVTFAEMMKMSTTAGVKILFMKT